MNIPNSFKEAQRRAFQDKCFCHMKSKEIVGSLGSITTEPDRCRCHRHVANVQYVQNEMIAEEYGLRLGVDIQITVSEPICIEKGDYVECGQYLYKVTETMKYDSYCAYYAVRE